MNKFVLIAFAFMGFAFYELSGGSDFVPGNNSLTVFAPVPPVVAASVVDRPAVVARADTTSVDTQQVEPVSAPVAEVVDVEQPAAQPDILQGVALASVAAPVEPMPIPEPAVEAVAEPEPEPAPVVEPDLRFVDGDRVNLRGGPGTDYAVVGKLLRDDMVEVLKDEGNGWLHLRVSATGDEGWMADWLLTAAN